MERTTRVVCRFVDMLGKWYLCHAASYQNAFGSGVNGFSTRSDAEKFAVRNGCTVEFHPYDRLQTNKEGA